MNTIRKFFYSPWFLSLIPLALIIAFTTGSFKRYVLETEKEYTIQKNHYIFYEDINNDGRFEKFQAANQDNTTGIAIRDMETDKLFDQWNFKGSFDFLSVKCLYIAGDKDGDGIKEVYVFTLSGDSVLLHCISDFNNSKPAWENRFIVRVGAGIKNPDPFIIPAEMQDLDGDGMKELIFGVSTGFSKYPRNVFAYFIDKDSLIMSPESYFYIQDIFQYDMDADGRKEIFPYGYATGNVEPEDAMYHDHGSFLMVLDKNLRFLFPPVKLGPEMSATSPVFNLPDGDSLLSFVYVPESFPESSIYYKVNRKGELKDSLKLPVYTGNIFCISGKKGKKYYLSNEPHSGLILFDDKWKIKKKLPGYSTSELFIHDLDNDGSSEFIVAAYQEGEMLVFRNGLRKMVSLKFNNDASNNIVSIIGNQIAIQSGQNFTLMKYGQNPLYPYYYSAYLLVYAGIVSFSLLVRASQKKQMQLKYDNEKKISELQLALVKNQLDPHFALNAINSIIYSAEYSDNSKTGDQLRAFAGLYRNMLLSATSVQRTISEELDFCRNYLELEKMRFGEGLNYEIVLAEDVDLETLIPKFSIQIHAENAIKHGLSTISSGGMLKILIRRNGNETIIEISDNGSGRKAASAGAKLSTGKGQKIMEELFAVYNKYYSQKVSSEISDLYNDRNEPAGTIVRITVRT